MILEVDDLYQRYGRHEVLSGISMHVSNGEKICLIGPSGCGKSTLLSVFSGTLSPSEGRVLRRFDRLSYVFQEDRLFPWCTVEENIHLVRPDAGRRELMEIIRLVDLEGYEKYKPSSLSGGMRQRVSIARGFFYPAELMLMDEPLKSLDHSLRMNLIGRILHLLRQTGRSLIYVTHEIDEALLIADRILVLSKNPARIAEQFSIQTEQACRDLKDPVLTDIRNRIIELLHLNSVQQYCPEHQVSLSVKSVAERTFGRAAP